MINLSSQILPRLFENKTVGLNIGKNTVLPYYQGLSLVNLPAAVCQLLGIPPIGANPLDNSILNELSAPYENVIFLLADGVRLSFFKMF